MGSKNALAQEAVSRPAHRPESKINPLFTKVDQSILDNLHRRLAETRCTGWTEMHKGGHFAAMEKPELLVKDIRAFANELYGNQPG